MTHSQSTSAPHSLKELLPDAQFVATGDLQFTRCHSHPAACQPGDLFVTSLDALEIDYLAVEKAIERGVVGIITEQLLPYSVPQCLVGDTRKAYGVVCQAVANHPTRTMLSIGVMGTHGKTTAALLVASMLKSITGAVAYRTSLAVSDSKSSEFDISENPTAQEIAQWLDSAQQANSAAAVIELTDEMIISQATAGLEFDVLIIPSFRKNQRHSSLRSRGVETALSRVCSQLKKHGLVIYCADDARLGRLIHERQLPSISYGLDAAADVQGRRLEQSPSTNKLLVTAGNQLMPVTSRLEGDHNARHVLAAIATGYAFGLELHEVITGVERLSKVPGRSQQVVVGQDVRVLVDVANQADRLAMVLHGIAKHHGGPVTCVAEVPDTATAEQRAAYGRVLERAASRVILTNTRHEQRVGQQRMWEVVDGCEKPSEVDLLPSREEAIRFALQTASAGEQILLAGLGTNPWNTSLGWEDDSEVATRLLREVQAQTDAFAIASCKPKSSGNSDNSSVLRIFRGE